MVKDGEDWHGLQTTNLKNSGLTIQDNSTKFSKATAELWCPAGGKANPGCGI